MAAPAQREDYQLVLTFGGGLNARRRLADVDPNEATQGENFNLDSQALSLQSRETFDLVATAPNAGAIDGFAQLIKRDGSVSTLVQAGTNVYEWDGATSFTLRGTVNADTKLRGPREHNFTLDEFVIITDLNKNTVVQKWDGTTFQDLNHNLATDFFAKYCRVHNERAFYANIQTSTDTPHLLVGSQLGDAQTISTTNRPSSSLGLDSPFFLVANDLRPINGLEAAFGRMLISTARGQLYRLSGSSAFDFAIEQFHVGSAVVGDEAIKNIGNDVFMGLSGRIESLAATEAFGDVGVNDMSLWIAPLVSNVTSWTIEYDRRLQRVYCFPNNQGAVYVFYKSMFNDPAVQGISPWSRWTTTHSINFTPNTVMQLVNPINGEDTIYMGDGSGRIFKLGGEGDLDGGTDSINVRRRSKLLAVPQGNIFDVRGWIAYRKLFDATITVRIIGGGVSSFTTAFTIPISGIGEESGIAFYGGDHYYNEDDKNFYGVSLGETINVRDWATAGQASHFQVEVESDTTGAIDLQEIGLEFGAAKT